MWKPEWLQIAELAIYFLATINPASKVFLLASMDPPYSDRELIRVSLRSTLAAFLILGVLAVAGNLVLIRLFRIDLYSLNISGGLVLLLVGLKAVREGRFYEQTDLQRVPDLSIVPLAAPLIAGPATIAASISLASTLGVGTVILSLACGLIANMLIMFISTRIGKILDRIHAIGPIIRITGLVVMAMAMQMMLNGFKVWYLLLAPGTPSNS